MIHKTLHLYIKNKKLSKTVFEIRLSNVLARKLQNQNIYIDSIEKFGQKSLVRINFHWPWATGPLLKSMTGKMNKGIQTKKIINQNRMQNNNYMYTSKYILYMKFQNFDPFSQTKIDYFIHRSSFSQKKKEKRKKESIIIE